ncbi:hypothetical protein GQ600_12796 [Phytophthora cactorum]|nr:hypothetical protein GQ600_12796 [Phytophthora cactorum]
MELKPIFDDDASDQDFTVGALTDFVIDSFHRNMHLGEEVVAAIMTDEARKAAHSQQDLAVKLSQSCVVNVPVQ